MGNTFLDEVPLDLSRSEVRELRDLFVLAYRRESEAEQLATAAGLVPGTFPLLDNMRLIWTELLREMANQATLRAIVEEAANDETKRDYQDRFKEMLAGNPAVRSSQPVRLNDDGEWKGVGAKMEATLFHERLMEKRSRLLHIDVARRVSEVAQSVALLEMTYKSGERAHGTGFLIQPNVLLTNHHNFFGTEDKPQQIHAVKADFDYEREFIGSRNWIEGKIKTVKGNAEHDWAIIELAQTIDRPPISLGTPFDIKENDTVIIVQHPLGAPKQFALDAMAIRSVDDQKIQYVADTQKGSSGSPVFNSSMHVVALHHAESQQDLMVDGKEETIWRNQGIRISRVMDDLTANGIEFLTQAV